MTDLQRPFIERLCRLKAADQDAGTLIVKGYLIALSYIGVSAVLAETPNISPRERRTKAEAWVKFILDQPDTTLTEEIRIFDLYIEDLKAFGNRHWPRILAPGVKLSTLIVCIKYSNPTQETLYQCKLTFFAHFLFSLLLEIYRL